MAIETKISAHSSWIDVKKKQKIISNTYGHFYFCNLSLAWYIKDSYIMIHVKDFADPGERARPSSSFSYKPLKKSLFCDDLMLSSAIPDLLASHFQSPYFNRSSIVWFSNSVIKYAKIWKISRKKSKA